MKHEELCRYVNEPVELKLVDGETITGELVAEEAQVALGKPFAVKQPEAARNAGPTWIGIADAAAVEWVRILEELPETLD